MAKRDPNRIQVDLRLLQDKNLRELRKFGDQFERSVDRLTRTLAKGGNFGGGGQFGNQARQPGSNSGQSAPTPDPNRGKARTPGADPPDETGRNWSMRGLVSRQAYAGPDLTEFEKAQFNLGNIGEMDAMAQMRYLSHILGRGGWDDKGNERDFRGSGAFRVASGAVGAIPRMRTYFQSAQGVIAHIANSTLGPAAFGQNIGLSRQSAWYVPGRVPFMSPAFKAGVGANLRSGWRSWFGFNPNYSTAQAKEAMGMVNQYGYDGHLANRMLDRMKDITETTGLDASTQMQLLDPAMRFGTDSMQGVVDALYQMPGAARAARMGLSQFSADLLSAAEQLAQSTGMTMGGATRALMSMSSVNGLAPQVNAGVMQSNMPLMMTLAKNGGDLYAATYGEHVGSQRQGAVMQMVQATTGLSLHAIREQLRRGDHSGINRLMWAQRSNPDLFGGLTIPQLLSMGNIKYLNRRTAAMETLAHVGEMKGAPNWNYLLHQLGLSQEGRSNFHAFQTSLAQHGITGHEAAQREQKWLMDQMDTILRKSKENARSLTYFELTPDAKRLVRFMDKTYPKATSNSGGDATAYAAPAIGSAYGGK